MIHKPSDMKVLVKEGVRGGVGRVTFQYLFEKEEIKAPSRLCARLTLAPGASIGAHRHEGEDELFVVLRGSGILDDGHSRTRVNAGDAILTGNGETHALENDGSEELELLALIMLYGAA